MKMYSWLLFLILMIPSICNAMDPVVKQYVVLLKFAIQQNDEGLVQDAITRSKNAGIPNLSSVVDGEANSMFAWASGYTPNTNILRMLLDNGADINSINTLGETALMKAIASNPSVVSFLLGQGADVNIATIMGETPLMKAIEKENKDLVRLLLHYRADVNAGDNWEVPLTMAVGQGDLNLVKMLLNNGGNPNVYGTIDPLWLALEGNKDDIALELLEHGAHYTGYEYYPLVQQYMKAKSVSPYGLHQRELGERRFR